MKTISLTSDQERKLNLILSTIVLDNFLTARREKVELPQMGKDAIELQKLLGAATPFEETV